MRDTASSPRSPHEQKPRPTEATFRRRRRTAVALPAAVVLGLAAIPVVSAQSSLGDLSSAFGSSGSSVSDAFAPSEPQQRTPIETEYPDIENLPAGVSVDRVEWITPRRIAVFINSAAMPQEEMQVQILLARDWHANPDRTFPEVWALDGLRAMDEENGWTIETNIEQQFADRNVNVILPVGGESSFYADWLAPDPKHNVQPKWETFLTRELVPILDNGFRSNSKRAVVGISMGGTSALNLAERNPHLFDFVGSFSGYLDTTTQGMPEAITAAMLDAGGWSSEAMWGPLYSQGWIDHDPKLGIDALKDMTVYVSSGSGQDDYGNLNSVARGPANAAGKGLEVISRMSTQTFVDIAKAQGKDVLSFFRPSGVHSWEYWQYELNEAWPYMAAALEIPEADRGADCTPVGAIAAATADGIIGSCVNNEYPVGEDQIGRAQDFRAGAAYWSPDTGAHALFGAIHTRYAELDGPSGWLGFPLMGEQATPDGAGRYVHFENGSIYWHPDTGAFAIPADMRDYWGDNGWENSHIGYPTGSPVEVNGGIVQRFQNGWLTRNPQNLIQMVTSGEERPAHSLVHGAIAEKYGELDTANSALGFPTSDEIAIPGGAFQRFEHGNIYWSPETGAHVVMFGAIFDQWGQSGWEQGPLGFPTTDLVEIPAGGLTQDFQGGNITQINGIVQEFRS